jgi:hypothetical protein
MRVRIARVWCSQHLIVNSMCIVDGIVARGMDECTPYDARLCVKVWGTVAQNRGGVVRSAVVA